MEQALKSEIDKKQNEYFNRTEPRLFKSCKNSFPSHVYIADLKLIRKLLDNTTRERKRPFFKPNLHDYAVSALYMQDISFPHDWLVWDGKIITFHNLQDSSVGLTKIIDKGTAEPFACDEFYDTSTEHLSQFKYLLKKCLEAKLHKLKIKWIKDVKTCLPSFLFKKIISTDGNQGQKNGQKL